MSSEGPQWPHLTRPHIFHPRHSAHLKWTGPHLDRGQEQAAKKVQSRRTVSNSLRTLYTHISLDLILFYLSGLFSCMTESPIKTLYRLSVIIMTAFMVQGEGTAERLAGKSREMHIHELSWLIMQAWSPWARSWSELHFMSTDEHSWLALSETLRHTVRMKIQWQVLTHWCTAGTHTGKHTDVQCTWWSWGMLQP